VLKNLMPELNPTMVPPVIVSPVTFCAKTSSPPAPVSAAPGEVRGHAQAAQVARQGWKVVRIGWCGHALLADQFLDLGGGEGDVAAVLAHEHLRVMARGRSASPGGGIRRRAHSRVRRFRPLWSPSSWPSRASGHEGDRESSHSAGARQMEGGKTMIGSDESVEKPVFSPAIIGALAHLYRGEVYRSTVWRNRLDATTNWAVVATGIALSVTFSSASASPLPLALVGLLVAVFLCIEARRYRFFDFWRIRAHVMELHFFGPMLLGQGVQTDNGWNRVLYKDYFRPNLHITFMESVGRRLRNNYGFIFGIQVVAYLGKILIHPTPIGSIDDLWVRAAIGPLPGQLVLLAGLAFHATWITIAIRTLRSKRGRGRKRPPRPEVDRMLELAAGEAYLPLSAIQRT
jgi:uncharacterized membrane protein